MTPVVLITAQISFDSVPRLILLCILATGIFLLLINRAFVLYDRIWPKTLVREHHLGLHFHRGCYVGQLEPGEYRFRAATNQIDTYDMRESPLLVSGQEVLSSDNLGLKVSLQVHWRYSDLVKATSVVSSCHHTLYADIQATCRQVVEYRTCEELLKERSAVSTGILEILRIKADRYGIEIVDVSLRDFMLPANLKAIYSKVAEARQEGLASLERARGETAALRSLANAARLMSSNSGLGLLRTLQTLENTAGTSVVVLPTEILKTMNLQSNDKPDSIEES